MANSKQIFFLLCTKEKDLDNTIQFSLERKNENNETIEFNKNILCSSNFENMCVYLYKITYEKEGDFEETISISFTHNGNKYSTDMNISNEYSNFFYYSSKWNSDVKIQTILIDILPHQIFNEYCKIKGKEEEEVFNDLYKQTVDVYKKSKDIDLFLKLFKQLASDVNEWQKRDILNDLLKSYESKESSSKNENLMEETLESITSLYENGTSFIQDFQENLHIITLEILISLKKSISDFLQKDNFSDLNELKTNIIQRLVETELRDVCKDDILKLIEIIKEIDEDFKVIPLLKKTNKKMNDVMEILEQKWEIFEEEIKKEREDEENNQEACININLDYIEPNKDDEIEEVIKQINKVLSLPQESNILIIDKELWEKYLELFQEDCEKLYNFWLHCKDPINIDKDNVEQKLFETILNSVKNNKLDNEKLFHLLIKTKDIFIKFSKDHSLLLQYLSNGINPERANNNEYIQLFHDVDFKNNIFGTKNDENKKLYIDFVKNIFMKCNTTNDCNIAMRLFDYFNKEISYEEIEIIVQNLRAIMQSDSNDEKIIDTISSIIITLLNNTPNNKKSEISTQIFDYVNKKSKSVVISKCLIQKESKSIKNELFQQVDINDTMTLMKIINGTVNQVKNNNEYFNELCLFFLDKVQTQIISIENDLFYYNNDNNDNEKDISLSKFKLYNLFNKDLHLFEINNNNNNIFTDTTYYQKSKEVINKINSIISSHLNGSQINCIVQKPKVFKQKLLYLNIKNQQEIDNYVNSIVNQSQNKQENKYPIDTELYQLALSHLGNEENTEIKLKEIFTRQEKCYINDFFIFLFSKNSIKNLDDEVEKFCSYYQTNKNLKTYQNLKYNIYCISHFNFIQNLFTGLNNLLKHQKIIQTDYKNNINTYCNLLQEIKDKEPTTKLNEIKKALSFLETKQFELFKKDECKEHDLNNKIGEILSLIDDDSNIDENNIILMEELSNDTSFSSYFASYKTFTNMFSKELQDNSNDFCVIENLKKIITQKNENTSNSDDFINSLKWLKYGRHGFKIQNSKSKEDENLLKDLLGEKSTLNIKKNDVESCVDCIVIYKNGKLSFEELLALRSRFLLTLKNNIPCKIRQQNMENFIDPDNITDNKLNENETISLLQINSEYMIQKNLKTNNMLIYEKLFCDFIFNISMIIDKANEIIKKGFLFDCNYNVSIDNIKTNNIELIDNNNQNNKPKKLTEITKDFTNKLETIEKQQAKIYKEDSKQIILTFIYGENIGLFTQFLKTQKDFKSNIKSLLQFITNGQINSEEQLKKGTFPSKKDFYKSESSIYDSIYNYVNKIFQLNNINEEDIFTNKIISSNKDHLLSGKKGLFIYLFNKLESFSKQIIWLFKETTDNLPSAKNVLFCSSHTSNEELMAFLYRSVLCKSKQLFTILFPEKLNRESSDLLAQIITNIKTNNYNYTSCIVFMCEIKTSDIYKELQKDEAVLLEQLDKFEIDIKKLMKVTVIKSEAAGIGKSMFIKGKVKNENQQYIYFPLGGNFSEKKTLERLLNLRIDDKKNIIFHLDLGDTKKEDEFKEFLFSFLILKMYSYSNKYFFVPFNIEVYIELPFGFYDLDKKFKLLSIFNSHTISKKLQDLIIEKEVTSNQQIVLNYLKYYHQLTDKNIFCDTFRTDTMDEETIIESSIISAQAEINKLIYWNDLIKVKLQTYYQIKSFFDIMGIQLKYMSTNIYLEVNELKQSLNSRREVMNEERYWTIRNITRKLFSSNKNKEDEKQKIEDNYTQLQKDLNQTYEIRKEIVKSFIDNTIYFIKGAYDELISNQKSAEYDNESENKANDLLSKETEQVSFQQIKTPLVFINEDGTSISIISNLTEKSKEYGKYRHLFNSGDTSKMIPLIDYNKLNHKQFVEEMNKILDLKFINSKEYDILYDNVICDYKFTADNFIKMVLILLKVRARIPVIMMGETGCGKTFLIKMLAELMESKKSKVKENYKPNKEHKKLSQMKIFNVHAGTTDDDLMEFMIKEKLLVEDSESSNNVKKKEKTIWVFLDEINTCNSMNLIKEMMTNYTILGKAIKKEVTFIAACNPYRRYNVELRKKRKKYEVGLKIKEFESTKFVYSVKPLPHSLLNYVFNFGILKEKDSQEYIKSMTNDTIISSINGISSQNQILQTIQEAIFAAQKYIRENNDPSSVSLREVRRFNIFYKNFFHYLSTNYPNTSKETLSKKSAILSIHLCYFCRIPDNKEQQAFNNIITKIMNMPFIETIKEEEENFYKYVTIPPNIAKTNSLLRILFAMFFCIISKIPVFICGKPGCSKSLSFNILYNSMQGNHSANKFFKQYPSIIKTVYQGSLGSTSKGIIEAFESAKRKSGIELKSCLSLLLFDEIGLAEISNNNPLKVLHSYLEYDEQKGKIAFVGISNWALDASKMNRGVYVSINEPSKDDLEEIANTISKHASQLVYKSYNDEILKLSEAYYYLKQEENSDNNYSLRDFYFLIRQITFEFQKQSRKMALKDINNIIDLCIERNFGPDLKNGINIMKSKYYNTNHQNKGDYNQDKAIQSYLDSDMSISRFLMLISDDATSHYLVQGLLASRQLEYTIFIGSQFPSDIDDENYSMSILNKIRIQLEKGHVLVLKNLKVVYPSLYDLFNQNYLQIGNKLYTNIVVGYSGNFISYINDKFKCILLIEEKEYNNSDPPLKSRFEKHKYSYDLLLSNELKAKAKDIYNEITKSLFTFKQEVNDWFNDKQKTLIKKIIENQLINLTLDEIYGMVYNINKSKPKNNQNKSDEYIDYILERIVPTFSQDVISYIYTMLNSKFVQKVFSLYKHKVKNYRNLEEYITYMFSLPKDDETNNTKTINSKRCVVFTFSTIISDISLTKIKENMYIENVTLSKQIKCDSDIEKVCDTFYNSGIIRNEKKKQENVLIIRFSLDESKHFGHLNSAIDNFEKKMMYQKEKKFKDLKIIICYIVHLKRVNTSPIQTFVSHISTQYQMVFIDNLSNNCQIKIEDLLEKEHQIMEIQERPFSKINSVIQNKIHEIINEFNIVELSEKNEKKKNIIEDKLMKDEGKIITKIIKLLSNEKLVFFEEYFKNIDHYNSNLFISNKVSLIDIIADIRNKSVVSKVKLVLYSLIKESFLFPFLLSNELNHNLKTELLDYYLDNKKAHLLNCVVDLNKIQVITDLSVPCVSTEIRDLIRRSKDIILIFKKETNREKLNTKITEIYNKMSKYPILKFFDDKSQKLTDIDKILKNEYYLLFKWTYLKDVPKKQIKNFFSQFMSKYKTTKHEQLKMKDFASMILLVEANSNLIKNLILILMNLPKSEIDKFEIQFKGDKMNDREYIQKVLNLELEIVFRNLNDQKYENNDVLQSIILYATQIESFSKTKENSKRIIMLIKQYISYKQLDQNHQITNYLDLLQKEKESNQSNCWDIIKQQISLILKQECNYEEIVFILSEKLNIYPFLSENILKYVLEEETKLLPFIQKILHEIFNNDKTINTNYFLNQERIKENNYLFFFYGGETIKGENKNIYKIINDKLTKNNFFAHSLFYYFCSQLSIYFTQHKHGLLKKKIFSFAMKQSLTYLYNADKKPCLYHNIHQLFCIAYNKVYLTYCIEYLEECRNRNKETDVKEIEVFINECIPEIKNTCKCTKAICQKTYIQTLKLFILMLCRNYEQEVFSQYQNLFDSLLCINQRNINLQEKNDKNKLKVLFIFTNQFALFNKMDDLWNKLETENNFKDSSELIKFIQDNQENNSYLFECFVDILINKVLSQLYIKNQFQNIITSNFSSFIENILPNFNITDEALNLIKLLFSFQQSKTHLFQTEIINLNEKEYEIYFYAFYFALICSLNKDSFYGSLFSDQINISLNDNYIPGGEPYEEQILHSYYCYQSIKKNFRQGFYICGGTKDKFCGYFYQISPCGLPSQEFICTKCKATIAGKKHKLTKETDYRIYYDENELEDAKKSFKEAGTIKYKLFNDFENELTDKIMKPIKGMNRVTQQFFNGNAKKVRKMKHVVYRVLNFILYACIHFSKHLGYIDKDKINKFIPYKIINDEHESLNTLDVLKFNWDNIKECLQDQKDIHIFMNMLVNNTSFKREIHDCPKQLNEQQRESFEDAISRIIIEDENNNDNNIDNSNYNEFAETYNSQRQNLLLKSSDFSLKLNNIINQTIISLPQELKNEFPKFDYFHLSTFPTQNSLKIYLQNHNDVEFSLLEAYLHKKESFNLLKNITQLNPLVNYIYNECDFKFSREEINSKQLNQCIENKSEIEKLLSNFSSSFNKFFDLDLQHGCQKIQIKHKIDVSKADKSPIGYFLVDNGSIQSNGIILVGIYELLANKQNDIISSITSNKTNDIAKYLKQYLEQEVMIQDATEEDILSMEYNSNNSIFNSFEEMISYYSKPCFFNNKNNEIVYSKYKEISFDLNQIETQLVNVLLPGKKKLSLDLRYINLKYEGYANDRAKIIDNYCKMYKREELGEKTKKEIKDNMKKCNHREKIYNCLQYLIHYIYRNEFTPDTTILAAFNKSNYGDKTDFQNLMKAIKKEKELTVTKIIDFIEFIEDQFFDDFKKMISKLYLEKIEDDEYNNIKEWMSNKKEDPVITSENLRSALKKFILRFLCVSRENGMLPPEQELFNFLLNVENIWEYFVIMHPHFEFEKKDLIRKFNKVKLSCTIDFYEKLNIEIEHKSKK